MVFSSPIRPWLFPSFALLAALTGWGVLRYPHLPDRIPKHIGVGGVDAWTDRSIGSAFLLVFVYAGMTVLLAACAELTLRVTPTAEYQRTGGAPLATAASLMVNRPATRASARRVARALLLLNVCVGVSFLAGCGVLWRSTAERTVPGWLLAALFVPLLTGVAATVSASVQDRRERRDGRNRGDGQDRRDRRDRRKGQDRRDRRDRREAAR